MSATRMGMPAWRRASTSGFEAEEGLTSASTLKALISTIPLRMDSPVCPVAPRMRTVGLVDMMMTVVMREV